VDLAGNVKEGRDRMSEHTYRIWIEKSQDGLQWELVATGTWTPPAPGTQSRFDPDDQTGEPVMNEVLSKLINFTPCNSVSGSQHIQVKNVQYRMRFERS
jgi:hypothetical protein